MFRRAILLPLAGAFLVAFTAPSASAARLYSVGSASVDITPDYPIRLSGYASRKSEATNVAQKIWVKALAFGSDAEGPAILLAVDNCGVPKALRDALVRKLARGRNIAPERVTICSTHTHSAPCLEGALRNLFLEPLSVDEQQRITRYTRQLEEALEAAALKALETRVPTRLFHGKTQATFAANRRTKGGPADHDVPVLLAYSESGELRAILATYACHCTTLTGEFNQVCGDWAGYAREMLEERHPGSTVLITIGCGGDANPNPRPGWDLARKHGAAIADAVNRLVTNKVSAIVGALRCRTREIQIPFDTLPTREEWELRAKARDYIGKHARGNLARLDRNEALPKHLDYLVQTWEFGSDLAVAFLPGEVVVDYALRLKREFDPARFWVTAYANDVPCYIPSDRVLKEGGYEGEGAMVYYDLPARFAPGIEDRIVAAVHTIVSTNYLSVVARN